MISILSLLSSSITIFFLSRFLSSYFLASSIFESSIFYIELESNFQINLKDWGLDGNASILFGKLGKGYKNTTRYKEAERTLYNARDKYKDRSSTVLTGHSQGGTVTSYLPMDDTTKGFALNAGFTFGQKVSNRNGKLKHYRLLGDPVSILSSGSKNQNTLYGDTVTPLDFIKRPFQSAVDIHKQNAKSAHILI